MFEALEENRRVGLRPSEAFLCKEPEAGDVTIVDGGRRRRWTLQPVDASRVV